MSGSLRARAPGSLPLPKAASESAPVPAASSSIAQTADGPSPFPQEFLSCPARFLLSRRGGGRYHLAGASVTQACRKHTIPPLTTRRRTVSIGRGVSHAGLPKAHVSLGID